MTGVPDLQVLGELELFRGLTSFELQQIHDNLKVKWVAAGANLLAQNHLGEAIYIVLEGKVKIYIEQVDGKNVTLNVIGPGEVLGEISAVDGGGYSASAVTLDPSRFLWMGKQAFRQLLHQMPTMFDNLSYIQAYRARQTTSQIGVLATMNTSSRLARQLLFLANRYGKKNADGSVLITHRFTQDELAGMIGASRSQVNRALGSLRSSKIIADDHSHCITILNESALTQRCL